MLYVIYVICYIRYMLYTLYVIYVICYIRYMLYTLYTQVKGVILFHYGTM